MNEERSFERFVADHVAGPAGGIRMPDAFYDDIHAYASRTRQRPEWLALIKEPPMRIDSRLSVGSPTARVAAIMVATFALLLTLTAAVVAASTLLSEDGPVDSGDWPMFKRDAARTGATLDGPVGGPVLQWRYAADGSVSQTVSIVDDLVYIASDDGVLRAVGRADGLERWRYATDTPPLTGPAVVDGVIYVVDGSEVMVAIDALTGSERWRSTTPLPGGASPIPAEGVLLVGTATGDLVAIDAVSGTEAWRAQVSPTGGAVRSPAYADGRAYVASDGGGFVALDTSSHEILWRFDTGEAQTGTAGVIDGIAYIGGSGTGGDGLLWALDAVTGEELWRIDEPIFTPAVTDGAGYSGSVSGLITAFDTTSGAIRWQTSVEGTARPLAVADDVVYVPADGEQRVYALDAQSGDALWRFDLDAGIDCCIAVAHGSVFVGTRFGSVYAIGGDGGEPPGPPPSAAPGASAAPGDPPRPSATATPGGSATAGAPPAELEWSTDGGADPMRNPSGVAIAPDGRIWVVDSGNSRIGIFEPDGTLVEYWGTEGSGPGEFVLHRANGDGSSNVAFAPDGSFYVLDAGGQQIQHWSAERQLIREWGGFGSDPGSFIAPGWLTTDEIGNVYVVDAERNVVEIFDPQGSVLRTFEASERPGTAWWIAVDPDGDIWVGTCCPDATLREFDATGRLLRTIDAETAAPLVFAPSGHIFSGQFPSAGAKDLIVVFDKDLNLLDRFGGVPGTPDGMGFPWGIALDGSGNIYVSNYGAEDGTTGALMKYRLQGELAETSPATGQTSAAASPESIDESADPPVAFEWSTDGGSDPMRYPSGVTIAPDGRIWVVDSGNSRIGIFEPDGSLVEYWGTAGDGEGEFILHRANGDGFANVAFAPDGSFYVLDAGGRQIQHWSAERQLIREWGGFGTEPGTFADPLWLTTDVAGRVYVVDDVRNVVEVFDGEGNVLRTFEANSRPDSASSIAVDPDGDIWVGTCCPDSTVRQFDPGGELVMTFGSTGTGDGQFSQAGQMAFDRSGRVFIGQPPPEISPRQWKDLAERTDRVQVFDQDGAFVTRFGRASGRPDSGLVFPWGIALDGSGSIYITEYDDGTGVGTLKKYRLLGDLRTDDPRRSETTTLPPDGTYRATIPPDALNAAGWPAPPDGALLTLVFEDATLTSTDPGGTCGAELGVQADIVSIIWVPARGPCSGEADIRWELLGDQLFIRPVPESEPELAAILGSVPFTRID